MTKEEIRSRIRICRKEMSVLQWQEKSHEICQQIVKSRVYEQAEVIYAYLAKQGEVLLDEVILDAIAKGKQVAVPKVMGKEMKFFKLQDLSQVEPGCMGIREPLSREEILLSKETVGLMLLPAVAVDEQGHRIGYGGGYYDRYLERDPQWIKVAAVFGFQVYEQVPAEALDVPLDGIVTEERTWETGRFSEIW